MVYIGFYSMDSNNKSLQPFFANISSTSDCVAAQLYVVDPGYTVIRWAHVTAGGAILFLLLQILLLINVLLLYAIFGLSYVVTSLRFLFISTFHANRDPCACLTPVWLAFILRMPGYIYLIASPLFHFTIMIERVRATIFVKDYEREGVKCGIGGIILIWTITALFSLYIVYTSLLDTVTFSKPLIYLSMTTQYNSQVFINIHYLFLLLVFAISLADYVLIRLNKLVIRMAIARAEYNLSRAYQANENIGTIRVLFPLDFSYTLFFTGFIIVSGYVRTERDQLGLLAYNRAYEGIQLILSAHAIISIAAYLYFLKKNDRRIAGNRELSPAEQSRRYFGQLRLQWQ